MDTIKQRFVLGSPTPLAAPTGVDIAADNISATNVTTTNLAATNITATNTITGTQYVFADQFPGATAGDKINAAIASIVTNGATVDATGLTGAQTIGSTILVNKSIRLVFGCATFSGLVNPLVEISASDSVITSPFSKCALFNQTLPPGNGIKIDPGANHVLIENIGVQGTAPLPNMPSGQMQQYLAMWAAGTSTTSVEDLTVRNCFIGNGTTSMVLEWCNNSRILGNEFVATAPTSPMGVGVPGIANAIVIAGAHNVIDGNSFQTTGNVSTILYISSPFQNFTSFPGPNYNVISNNILTALTPLNNEALVVSGAFCTVANNVLKLATKSDAQGVTLGIAIYPPVSGVGITYKNGFNTIRGNTIDMADGSFSPNVPSGISIFSKSSDSNGTIDHNVVVGNTVSCPGSPVSIVGGSYNMVSGNTFVVTGGSASVAAMNLFTVSPGPPTSNNIITGNVFSGFNNYGINVAAGAAGYSITGNRFIGGTPASGGFITGISVASNAGTRGLISGNSFSNLNGYGIATNDPAGQLSIGFNYFADVATQVADILIASVGGIQPSTSGPIRIASNHTAGKGITLSNGVTADHTWIFPDAADQFVGLATTDTLANKTLQYPAINQGISPFGTGWTRQTANFAAIAPNTVGSVTVTWFTPFADTSYLPMVSVLEGTGSLLIRSITSLTAAGITVAVFNTDTVNAHGGELFAEAIHF